MRNSVSASNRSGMNSVVDNGCRKIGPGWGNLTLPCGYRGSVCKSRIVSRNLCTEDESVIAPGSSKRARERVRFSPFPLSLLLLLLMYV